MIWAAAIAVYVIGFGWGFVALARRSHRSRPLFPVFDPAAAGLFGGILWPLVLLTLLAIRDSDERPSRAERKASVARRVAEDQLREAQALRERERLLGL